MLRQKGIPPKGTQLLDISVLNVLSHRIHVCYNLPIINNKIHGSVKHTNLMNPMGMGGTLR